MRTRPWCARTVALVTLAATLLLVACAAPATTPNVPAPAPSASATPAAPPTPSATSGAVPADAPTSAVTFAVIGDYGTGDVHEKAVERLVASWRPAFVIAAGDDYYKVAGETGLARYARSTGAIYGRWVAAATGIPSPASGEASRNAFFPVLGNHDYSDASLALYVRYFALPGAGFTSSSHNERYYDFVAGDVHFFMLNSNPGEPDGIGASSKQAAWLKRQLSASTARWNVVVDHHPPYSSDAVHGSTTALRWPFAAWGADLVISGHAHVYERVERSGITYVVDGLGGAKRYAFATKHVGGSAVRYARNWGALRVSETADALVLRFVSVSGATIDTYRIAAND